MTNNNFMAAMKPGILALLSLFCTAALQAQEEDFILKEFDLSEFLAIESEVIGEVEYRQGAEYALAAEGKDEFVNDLIAEVKGGVLHLSMEKDLKKYALKRKKDQLVLRITSPDLEKIAVRGMENIRLDGMVETEDLVIESKGVGKVSAENILADRLTVISSGVGKTELRGTVSAVDIDSEGVGKIDTEELTAEDVSVNSSGIGSITVYASRSVKVRSQGVGGVVYYGEPENVDIEKNGIGKIRAGK